jgi:hypothetical protein
MPSRKLKDLDPELSLYDRFLSLFEKLLEFPNVPVFFLFVFLAASLVVGRSCYVTGLEVEQACNASPSCLEHRAEQGNREEVHACVDKFINIGETSQIESCKKAFEKSK